MYFQKMLYFSGSFPYNIENHQERKLTMEERSIHETEPVPAKKKSSVRLPRWLYRTLLIFFAAMFTVSLVLIGRYAIESFRTAQGYNDLAGLKESLQNITTAAPTTQVPTTQAPATVPPTSEPTVPPTTAAPTEPQILPEYLPFYEQNNDMVGWIEVPGTKINYPVMQTPGNKDYYLKRDFYHNWSEWGSIYAREACDINKPSDNVVLYGHHMKDGSMFAGLDAYRRKSYWEENQYFTFDTLYERHTYQIIAVFKTSANIGEGFAYHIFNTADSEEEFNQFMDEVHKLQMYKTGLTAEYGDMLLTLSTCEYTLDNGRFVVVAKRVS